MDYRVEALTPQLAQTFVSFFEQLDFGHAPHWSICFCRWYYNDCPVEEWYSRSASQNRAEALTAIQAGHMPGYLAFDGDQCIGWCNAVDIRKLPRLSPYVKELQPDKKIGCVICFAVHQDYRGQGVARLLLKHAVEGFRKQGFDSVIGLPIKDKVDPVQHYRGTLNMYHELGFVEIIEADGCHVMELELSDE